MPFTLSHAAAVLPFSRRLARWRMLSAATIGAMVPDSRVFVPWHLGRVETHSALSLLTFCLPLGLMIYWFFQRLLKAPLMTVLPDGAYARWQPVAAPADIGSARQWLLAAAGIVAGAVSHLVWDAFTHEGARGVRLLPVLDEPYLDVGRHHVVGMRLMQDGSSLLGLCIVLLIIGYALRRGSEPAVPNRELAPTERGHWALGYGLAAVAATAGYFAWSRIGEPHVRSLFTLVNDMAIASLRGLATALVLVSLALRGRLRTRSHRSSGPKR
jgi:hypothetical protein